MSPYLVEIVLSDSACKSCVTTSLAGISFIRLRAPRSFMLEIFQHTQASGLKLTIIIGGRTPHTKIEDYLIQQEVLA